MLDCTLLELRQLQNGNKVNEIVFGPSNQSSHVSYIRVNSHRGVIKLSSLFVYWLVHAPVMSPWDLITSDARKLGSIPRQRDHPPSFIQVHSGALSRNLPGLWDLRSLFALPTPTSARAPSVLKTVNGQYMRLSWNLDVTILVQKLGPTPRWVLETIFCFLIPPIKTQVNSFTAVFWMLITGAWFTNCDSYWAQLLIIPVQRDPTGPMINEV